MWKLTISDQEVQCQLVKRSHQTEILLEQERAKKSKLEGEFKELKQVVESQADTISALTSEIVK